MSFRDNLQSLRAQKNMTQEQLAMLLGVSRQSVTKWEAERSYPEMDKLIKICDIFECSLDDLVKGDLTCRVPAAPAVTIPTGKPVDVCGYDEHHRMLAWKIPTGVAAILMGVAFALLFECQMDLGSESSNGALFVMTVFVGIIVGLTLIVPAGMAHSSFVKAHPFVEDFYTEEDKAQARKRFSGGLVAGIAFIFAGVVCMIMIESEAEGWALFLLLLFVALGVWNIVHYGLLLGRTNVAEYNKSVADELEMEEIVNAQVDEAWRNVLKANKRRSKKLGAVCGVIMLVSTIVGLTLLFVPVFSAPDPSEFEPLGTSASWFWMAWVVGGILCGIVTLLWDAFGKED